MIAMLTPRSCATWRRDRRRAREAGPEKCFELKTLYPIWTHAGGIGAKAVRRSERSCFVISCDCEDLITLV